ncbi:MAG: Crp/Fnr family transcriptional regulator [Anaerolineaceae bacterium]|jgi:CRP/FNR family transcriptional regulator|nr:Crp/Fnr family transcriptional regulator [Anaerolineaceae bacterium]
MTPTLAQLLKGNRIFKNVDGNIRDKLISLAKPRDYLANTFLTLAGERWSYLFLVVKGNLVVLKESSEGRTLTITELGQGEVFWGPAFFEDEIPNPATIRFVQDSRLILWERDEVLPIFLENGSITWELSKLMLDRMLKASDIITGLAFQPVAGRLANLLMNYPHQSDSGPMVRTLTLDDMAMRIGTTREMVCRFLQGFADQGMIKITRTELEIIDRSQLTLLAQKEKA